MSFFNFYHSVLSQVAALWCHWRLRGCALWEAESRAERGSPRQEWPCSLGCFADHYNGERKNPILPFHRQGGQGINRFLSACSSWKDHELLQFKKSFTFFVADSMPVVVVAITHTVTFLPSAHEGILLPAVYPRASELLLWNRPGPSRIYPFHFRSIQQRLLTWLYYWPEHYGHWTLTRCTREVLSRKLSETAVATPFRLFDVLGAYNCCPFYTIFLPFIQISECRWCQLDVFHVNLPIPFPNLIMLVLLRYLINAVVLD